jgi:type VI secretion system protein ImpH
MATTSRPPDLDVSRSFLGEELREHPGWFQFFQAVRLMHRMLPDREPVGRFALPGREVLRFSANNLLAFPPARFRPWTGPQTAPPV